jgi:hypothetical protein
LRISGAFWEAFWAAAMKKKGEDLNLRPDSGIIEGVGVGTLIVR